MRKVVRLVPRAVATAILAGFCALDGGSVVAPPVAASPYDPVYMICKVTFGARITTSPPATFNNLSQCCMWAAGFSCAPGDSDCIAYDYNYCMMTSQAVINKPQSGKPQPDNSGFVEK